jgi:hypothetical protein
MLRIVSIDEQRLTTAADLLAKGFPERDAGFWARGVSRLHAYARDHDFASVGSILLAKDEPVGVLLKIPGYHMTTGQKLLNLSSWYVDARYRWFAPRMLQEAMADDTFVYTDFSPSENAIKLNQQLGFRTFASRNLLFALPFTALFGRNAGTVLPIDQVPEGGLSARQLDGINLHMKLGCMALAIKLHDTCHPVILDVISKRRIPMARVLYATSAQTVVDNLRPLSRFLLKRGVPLLSMVTPADVQVRHAINPWPAHAYQIKGVWQDDVINEMFSERVFLNA